METRKLGQSGLTVPAVGMGTYRTFDVSGSAAERHCFEIVNSALRVGTNLFDYGTLVTCAVTNSPFWDGSSATQTACAGWALVGNADTNGFTTGLGTNVTLVLTNDAVLSWQWRTNYWLETTNDGPGTVVPSDGWQAADSNIIVTAMAASHYHFVRWTGDTNFVTTVGQVRCIPESMQDTYDKLRAAWNADANTDGDPDTDR